MVKKSFLWVATWLFLTPVYGQNLYVTTEADGTKSFSDIPSANSEPYSLMSNNISGFSGANATDNSPDAAALDNAAAASNAPVSAYTSVRITQPADQTTFQNQTPISVIVATQPALKTGDQVKLMLDGVAYGSPQTSLTFTLVDLARGTHQVQAAILDKDGNTLKSGMPITLFKQQATVLLPVLPSTTK